MRFYTAIDIELNDDSNKLASIIQSQCRSSDNFIFDIQKSSEYSDLLSSFACQLIYHEKNQWYAALCFAEEKKKQRSKKSETSEIYTLRLVNIIPLTKSCLNIEEYNDIARKFVKTFKISLSKSNFILHVGFPEKLLLKNIIRGKKCRSYFQQYISSQSIGFGNFSFHPSTTYYLDLFIVWTSMYNCDIDIHALYTFMIKTLGWSSEDSNWVKSRIETGLEILEVKKSF